MKDADSTLFSLCVRLWPQPCRGCQVVTPPPFHPAEEPLPLKVDTAPKKSIPIPFHTHVPIPSRPCPVYMHWISVLLGCVVILLERWLPQALSGGYTGVAGS